MILSTTTSHCPDCDRVHEARYERSGDDVFFAVDCPRGEFRQKMTDDAELFLALRDKAGFDPKEPFPFSGYRHLNLFEITNDCDYTCAFCYAAANRPRKTRYRSADEILAIAREVLEEGGYALTLTGGEPTLHPELPDLVRKLKALGLVVSMPSNGRRLARDPELARALAAAGTDTVALQLDTLDPAVQKLHRNNEAVDEKLRAIENCRAAGLKLQLLPTVTRHNVGELGALLDFALEQRPTAYALTAQSLYADLGGGMNGEGPVSKEKMIRAIVASGVVPGLEVAHFWPMPKYYGLRIAVHPDCGAVAAIALVGGRRMPAEDLVDVRRLYARLAAVEKPSGFKRGMAAMAYHAFASAKRGKRGKLIRAGAGMATSSRTSGLFFITVESFMASRFQDEDRAKRCATAMRIPGGINQRGCYANRIAADVFFEE